MVMDTQHSELLHEIHRELKTLTTKVESAFVKDDDGEPDYAGHRFYHKKQNESDAEYSKHRAKIFREIVTWIAIAYYPRRYPIFQKYFAVCRSSTIRIAAHGLLFLT